MNVFNFDNSYRNLDKRLYSNEFITSSVNPELVLYNLKLADKLGIPQFDYAKYLSGQSFPTGANPIAQAYAGHQFGYLNMLGDGRALLLGEHITPKNRRFDIQLKGSGRTPYSRNGDGKATLYSMLREYLISHAMEYLNIPTTRSLAVIKTGERVLREIEHSGAILTRVASSHIRVGTFQFVAMQQDEKLLRDFTHYTIKRHYPELENLNNTYLAFFNEVMNRQIDLIINWLRVGFIHGVMNTDNVSISGETIDYGPCAFMDIYNPNTVFSSIDKQGRYSFINQGGIGKWNMARFAETLLPLIEINKVNEILSTYDSIFKDRWYRMMGNKIGIENLDNSAYSLIDELLIFLEEKELDYTSFFRDLSKFEDNKLNKSWNQEWKKLNPDKGLMDSVNPAVIPRNSLVEDVLQKAAFFNNFEPFNEFLNVLSTPYLNRDDFYTFNPESVDKSYKTFCGT